MSFLIVTHLEFSSSHIKHVLYCFDSVSFSILAQLKEYQKQPPHHMTMYCIFTFFFRMKSTHNVVSNVIIFYPLSIIANYCKCKLQTGCPGCLHVNTVIL